MLLKAPSGQGSQSGQISSHLSHQVNRGLTKFRTSGDRWTEWCHLYTIADNRGCMLVKRLEGLPAARTTQVRFPLGARKKEFISLLISSASKGRVSQEP